MRYFIKLAYKGTHYHGWQMQPNASSVQEVLTVALSKLLKTTVAVTGAGRTDSGVHAREMYAHFDCDALLVAAPLVQRLNLFLPKDIVVYDVMQVDAAAHARFDAVKRTYEYHIHTTKDVFENDGSFYFWTPLVVSKMNAACELLLKHTDFECFSKVQTDVGTFNCVIFDAHWQQVANKLIFTITADRFLRNMVRAIVGTMLDIGTEKISLADFESILASKDRNRAGFSVPAQGLYLTKIEYEL
ncbi:tRNA pseudouridine(38-40) synthase TruA [Flavobacterium sp.]|uniref:tRNA pseudouridine(38-40) synthase TruA n=1 Tax=Flavobacterium sp. TaxID=239 RepID=UPI0025D892DC|nr:tRNA pseudouridine(38-40) synthase TruA [Flavobacterium sp.]